jgi:hypothetical protein
MDAATDRNHIDAMIKTAPFSWTRRSALGLTLGGLSTLALRPALANWPDVVDERWMFHDPASAVVIDHEDWTQFLRRFLQIDDNGVALVRYDEISDQDRGNLRDYIARLSSLDFPALNRNEQLAAWINLYNAATVEVILQNYPVDSIRDITDGLLSFGPWGMDVVTVDGQALSLDDIEHGILRPIWQDPRIHFVVNCASIGCPNLGHSAYEGRDIDERMDRATHVYINNRRGADLDLQGRLVVSGLFDWYDDDFGRNEEEIIDYIRSYAVEPLTGLVDGATEIEDYRYDWALNDASGMARPDARHKGSESYTPEAQAEAQQALEEVATDADSTGGRRGSDTIKADDFLDMN